MSKPIYVWSDVHDKSEQPWEAPSWEEAIDEVRRLQKLGNKNAGAWDTEHEWPFGSDDGLRYDPPAMDWNWT